MKDHEVALLLKSRTDYLLTDLQYRCWHCRVVNA